jgi:hypothetical protein
MSGIPAVGSVLVVGALALGSLPAWALISGSAFAVLDTGGLHWFVGGLAWQAMKSSR